MPYNGLKKSEGASVIFFPAKEPVAPNENPTECGCDGGYASAALLERIRQNDEAAFLEVYDRCHAAIYQFALQMSDDAGTAADVTQEVFVLLLERGGMAGGLFSRFDPARGTLEIYLLGVARKLTRKVQWKERRWTSFEEAHEVDHHPGPGEQVASRLTLAKLRSAIALLPVKYREVIVLCHLQERSYDEMALILGCSTGTVASRLSRARKLLAERL